MYQASSNDNAISGDDNESSTSEEMPSLTERSVCVDDISSDSSSSSSLLEGEIRPIRSSNVRRNAVPSSINLTTMPNMPGSHEVIFNPLMMPFVMNRGQVEDEGAALLFNPLTQFVIQSMASVAGRTNGVGGDNRADQRIEQLLASLFLDDSLAAANASLLFDSMLQPPVDVRRTDKLVCPTCMVVHLPVEGTKRVAIRPTTQEQNDRPQIQDNESYSAFFRGTVEADDDDNDSMPPLEDIIVDNDNEEELNELSRGNRSDTHRINEVSVCEDEEEFHEEDTRSTDQSLLNRAFEVSRDDDLFDTSSLSNSSSSGNVVQSNDDRNISEEQLEASPFLRLLIERTSNSATRQAAAATTEDNNEVPSIPITHLRDYGAIRVFAASTCPVCLDDHNPIVALKCGHCVCGSCFEQLGGYLASDI